MVEATVWAILWRFDALEWMWHVPVLLAAWLTLRAVQPGEGRRTPVFWLGGTMLLVSAATFMSGGAVVAAVVAVWVLLTMVASLLLRSARARPDRGR